eukprot:Selendium_serpulae@DN3446_c0_g1_i1.p1
MSQHTDTSATPPGSLHTIADDDRSLQRCRDPLNLKVLLRGKSLNENAQHSYSGVQQCQVDTEAPVQNQLPSSLGTTVIKIRRRRLEPRFVGVGKTSARRNRFIRNSDTNRLKEGRRTKARSAKKPIVHPAQSDSTFIPDSNEAEQATETIIPKHLNGKSDKTIVLDMDETLIHTQFDLNDYSFKILIQGTEFCVAIRPGLTDFLKFCREHFREVVLWTASRRSYADAIIRKIDPNGTYFTQRLYDTDCRWGGKRLSVLDRDPASVIFVDDQPGHFVVNLQDVEVCSPRTLITSEFPKPPRFYANQYLIPAFKGDPNDQFLYYAMKDFFCLKHTPDVRESFLKDHACLIMKTLKDAKGLNFDRWGHLYDHNNFN